MLSQLNFPNRKRANLRETVAPPCRHSITVRKREGGDKYCNKIFRAKQTQQTRSHAQFVMDSDLGATFYYCYLIFPTMTWQLSRIVVVEHYNPNIRTPTARTWKFSRFLKTKYTIFFPRQQIQYGARHWWQGTRFEILFQATSGTFPARYHKISTIDIKITIGNHIPGPIQAPNGRILRPILQSSRGSFTFKLERDTDNWRWLALAGRVRETPRKPPPRGG